MQNPPPVQTAKSSTGLDENIAALLSYLLGGLGGLIFFLIEKSSRLVKFHAMQSLLLNIVLMVGSIALWIIWAIATMITSQISGILSMLISLVLVLVILAFSLGIVIGAVLALIKAYQGQFYKLPVLGNFAEKFSAS